MEAQIYSPIMLILLFSIIFFTFIVTGKLNLNEKDLHSISSFIATVFISIILLVAVGVIFLIFSIIIN